MLRDAIWCSYCGALIRVYGSIYLHYNWRWFKKTRVCICQNCMSLMPVETDEDKPQHLQELISENQD